jgi:hypothetical protein
MKSVVVEFRWNVDGVYIIGALGINAAGMSQAEIASGIIR